MEQSEYILIVDDDPDARTILDFTLADVGVAVKTANNGAQAIELIQQSLPRLIFLDLMLPDVNGFEVLYWLRSSPRTAQIPVVIVSAYVGGMHLPQLDGTQVIQKGQMRSAPIRETAASIIQGQPLAPQAAPFFHAGVDPETIDVVRDAIRSMISPREMEVLQLMAEGQSNDQIAESLTISLNTVKSHGKALFEKLNVESRSQAVAHARELGLL